MPLRYDSLTVGSGILFQIDALFFYRRPVSGVSSHIIKA